MLQKNNYLAILLLIFLILPLSSYSQIFPSQNDASLEGVSNYDAIFLITTWHGVTLDLEQFTTNTQSSYELALGREGIVVDTLAPNFLYCVIKVAEDDKGLIFYSYEVEYFRYNAEGLHSLLWKNGGVVTLGRNSFTPQQVAQQCVGLFSPYWSKHNQ